MFDLQASVLTHELAQTKGMGDISVGIEQFVKRHDNS